jgi:SPFH domain / Band 7 family
MVIGEAAAANKAVKVLGATAGGGGVLAAAGAAIKPMVVIGENEMGVRTRFGKAKRSGWLAGKLDRVDRPYGTVGKGPHFSLTHSIKKVGVQDREAPLGTIIFKRGAEQLQTEASITWAVRSDDESLRRALFNIDNLEELKFKVVSICAGGLSRVLSSIEEADLKNDDAIADATDDYCWHKLDTYGAYLLDVQIGEPTFTIGQKLVEASGFNHPMIAAAIPGLANGNGTGENALHDAI